MIDTNYITNNSEHFQYLFDLQMSGRTNMFAAPVYLQQEQGLDRTEAMAIFRYWSTNYEEIAKEMGVDV